MTAVSAKRFRKDLSISSHGNTGIRHLPPVMLNMVFACLSSQEQAKIARTNRDFSRASKSAEAYHGRVQELGKTILDNPDKLKLFFEQDGLILQAIRTHQLIHKDQEAVRRYLVKFFIAKIIAQNSLDAGINFFEELPEHLKSYITELDFEDIIRQLQDAIGNNFSYNEAFYNRLLAHCPYLKDLVVVGNFDDRDELLAAAINQSQSLRSLRLVYIGSIGEDFFSKLRLPYLEGLEIEANSLTDGICYSFFKRGNPCCIR